MRKLLPVLALVAAAGLLSGCGEQAAPAAEVESAPAVETTQAPSADNSVLPGPTNSGTYGIK